MAEHRVRKNNIIYIIPTDELFIKWKNDEAFIDEYGRLMNRKPHRVLKELKHYVADSVVQKSYAWRCMFLSRNLWIMPICIKCSMNGEKEKIDFQMRRIILFTKAVRGHF